MQFHLKLISMCTFWPHATMFVNGVYPGRSLKTRFWVLKKRGIWSLQVPESPGKQCLNVCIRTLLYCLKLESSGYTSSPPIVCVYLHSNFHSLKMHAIWNKVRNGRSRSSTVVIFCTSRKRVCNFLLVINGNISSILPGFRDIAKFLLRTAILPLFHVWGYSPWTRLPMLWLRSEERRPKLIIRVINFELCYN